MITAVLDNQLWIDLLARRSPSLNLILQNLSDQKLTVYSSSTLETDFIQKIKTQIPTTLTKSFVSAFFPYFQTQTPPEHRLPFPPPLPLYLDLCLYSHPDYLVPFDYRLFKPIDGYQKINVLESDNFLSLLR